MKQLLKHWLSALDHQIGDTEAEIRRRREENAEAVEVRDDLVALIEYIDGRQLPGPVKRALQRCLEWNPHCK